MAMMCAEPAAGFARQASNLMPRMGHRGACRNQNHMHALFMGVISHPGQAPADSTQP